MPWSNHRKLVFFHNQRKRTRLLENLDRENGLSEKAILNTQILTA